MGTEKFYVEAEWDEEAKIWYVADTNIPGLSTEGETLELLTERVEQVASELISANSPRRSRKIILRAERVLMAA